MTIEEFEKNREFEKQNKIRAKREEETRLVNKRNLLWLKLIKVRWALHSLLLGWLIFSKESNETLLWFIGVVMFFTAFEVFHGFFFKDSECKELTDIYYADEQITISSWLSLIYSFGLIYFCFDNIVALSFIAVAILTALPFLSQITDYESSGGLWFPGTGLGF